jgi:hypothetical protein
MAFTLSDVTKRSAAETAAAESIQVESPRTLETVEPPKKMPESVASFIASSAAAAMGWVKDSIGPVNPKMMPNFTSSAIAAVDNSVDPANTVSTLRIALSLSRIV